MGEQATTQVANAAVFSPPVEASVLQRKCDCGNHTFGGSECDSCKKEKGWGSGHAIQRSANGAASGDEVPPIVHEVLNSPGQPLDRETRNFFEPRFGHDFSGVRVHTDPRAAKSARDINAVAFTSGVDVVFGAGQFVPTSNHGRRVLAHELAHVVQQRAGVNLKGEIGEPEDLYEKHADAIAERVLDSNDETPDVGLASEIPATAFQPAVPIIQRQYHPSKQASVEKSPAGDRESDQPRTLPTATVSADLKSVDQILAILKLIRLQLQDPLISPQAAASLSRSLETYGKALLTAAIEPTPARDYISGPIHFIDGGNPHFFSFSYESLDDKAWKESWMSFYKFATMEVGILLSICEAIIEEPDTDRSFDESGKEKEPQGNWEKFGKDQEKQLPSYHLKYVEESMKWFAEKTGTQAATVTARAAQRLAVAIDAVVTAYEIYQANTQGPSLHAAAVETTARVMGRAFNMAAGINMVRGQGGEFIPHQDASTEVRVARNPLDRVPLPDLKDRRLAYDMVANRVYEMMMNVISADHLKSAQAFKEFRDDKIKNAGNIVDNAGASILEQSEKFGGKMILVREPKFGGLTPYVIETGKVKNGQEQKESKVVSCDLPIPLGSARSCGGTNDADSAHYDYPPKVPSKASKLKLAAWAMARHPLHLPIRSQIPDSTCIDEMDLVLSATAGTAGHDAVNRFVAGTGGTQKLDATTTLGSLALEAPSFLKIISAIQKQMAPQLAAQVALGELPTPCGFSKITPPNTEFRKAGPDPLALQAVLGGTQGQTVEMTAFNSDAAKRTYSANIHFVICDDFGVDETDLYFFGLIPFWILQHERSSTLYKPFVNELDLNVTVSGKF